MTKINYIQSGEDAVGKGHATKPDTLNRGVRDLQTLSGLDPDADFAGFALPSQVTSEAAARAAADTAALATAAADATTKANAAQAAAIAAASTDATTKANAAQAAAQSFATSAVGSEATTRAAADVSAIASAKTYADGIMATEQTARGNGDTAAVTSANAHADAGDATEAAARATAVTNALTTAANDATAKAATAQSAAQTFATNAVSAEATARATADAATLTSANAHSDAALATETTARTTGDTSAIATASADATTKANAAQSAATSAAATDATTKSNAAQAAAIAAAATDATTKVAAEAVARTAADLLAQVAAARYGTAPALARYVEVMATGGVCSGTPPGLTNYLDPGTYTGGGNGAYLMTTNVSGAAGSLTVVRQSGAAMADIGNTATLATASWAAVIQHDDGSLGFYTVTGSDGVSTINIWPALRSAVTNKPMVNRHNSALGQHYTQLGFRALAHLVYKAARQYTARGRWVAQMLNTATSGGWVALGGLVNGGFLSDGVTNSGFFYNSAGNISLDGGIYSSLSSRYLQLGVDTAAKGIEWPVSLRGLPGYVETFVGIQKGGPVTVEVELDGVVVSTTTVARDVQRITVPFRDAQVGKIRVKGTSVAVTVARIGTTTWWVDEGQSGLRVVSPFSKAVYIGDSWGAFYNGALPDELGKLMSADAGYTVTVVNQALGGQTSNWGRANFQSLVLDQSPGVVFIEFFTNDNNNADGISSTATWLDNTRWMVGKAIENGIVPVVMMPGPTGSFGQAQSHGIMAALLALGGSLDLVPATGVSVRTATAVFFATERLIFADATAGAITLIPPASLASIKGAVIVIKKTDASANAVIFQGTVEGVVNPSIPARYGVLRLVTDGTNWFNA